MELDEVVGKRPGPPPTYRVIFRVVAAGRRRSPPTWQPENLILHVDPNAKRRLREYGKSPRPPKRRRTAEPTEPDPAEQCADEMYMEALRYGGTIAIAVGGLESFREARACNLLEIDVCVLAAWAASLRPAGSRPASPRRG